MRVLRLCFAIVLIFQIFCCTNPAKNPGTDSTATKETTAKKMEQPAQTNAVASDENGTIMETRRDAILLFGKNVNVLPSELRQNIAAVVVSMNAQMTNASAV